MGVYGPRNDVLAKIRVIVVQQFDQYAFSAFIDTVEVDPTDKSFAKHG